MNAPFTYQQLAALHDIATHLAQPGELDPALHHTLHIMSEQLAIPRAMITVLRRDIGEIHTVAAHMDEEQARKGRYAVGEGITGEVVRTGRAIVVPRIDREPRFLNRTGARDHLDVADRAFICVPIRYGDTVVGTLAADFPASGPDALHTEQALLEAVANLIASRVERRRILEENRRLRHKDEGEGADLLLGSSDAIAHVRTLVRQVADSRTSVLLTGETGTGKGLVAKAIHLASPRRAHPFVHVNCGAIPENLIESELFGHEKGAFTGAVTQREGRFELAGHGTIFLDEINSLPPMAQVKLLRVIQDREFERVGSNTTLRAHARIVAATNTDLAAEVQAGRFRADLYYRLNVFPILIPPLRKRGADIMLLADHFAVRYAKEMGKPIERIDTPAIDMLMAYHWPGNVRELENAIERAVLLSEDGVITPLCLPPSLHMKSPEKSKEGRGPMEQLVASYEASLIKDALKDTRGNQTKAAELLGTTKRIIQYKIRKYGIDYKQFRRPRT